MNIPCNILRSIWTWVLFYGVGGLARQALDMNLKEKREAYVDSAKFIVLEPLDNPSWESVQGLSEHEEWNTQNSTAYHENLHGFASTVGDHRAHSKPCPVFFKIERHHVGPRYCTAVIDGSLTTSQRTSWFFRSMRDLLKRKASFWLSSNGIGSGELHLISIAIHAIIASTTIG